MSASCHAPPGDAHDFLRKMSAAQTEISAGIISVDIIPYRNMVKKNGYCTMKENFQTILIISEWRVLSARTSYSNEK
jgi:hypothetical protein